jgi:hypothetical protein
MVRLKIKPGLAGRKRPIKRKIKPLLTPYDLECKWLEEYLKGRNCKMRKVIDDGNGFYRAVADSFEGN